MKRATPSPPFPVDRSAGGPQIQFERLRAKKNLLPLPGIEPRLFVYSATSLVTILAQLVPASSKYWTMGKIQKPTNPM
jgi:hypothetical protein